MEIVWSNYVPRSQFCKTEYSRTSFYPNGWHSWIGIRRSSQSAVFSTTSHRPVSELTIQDGSWLIIFWFFLCKRLFSIKTSALRAGPSSFGVELPVELVGKKSSQGIGLAVSPIDGSIFFSPMSETAVAKWNPITNNQR